jgi:hypothetical protein
VRTRKASPTRNREGVLGPAGDVGDGFVEANSRRGGLVGERAKAELPKLAAAPAEYGPILANDNGVMAAACNLDDWVRAGVKMNGEKEISHAALFIL